MVILSAFAKCPLIQFLYLPGDPIDAEKPMRAGQTLRSHLLGALLVSQQSFYCFRKQVGIIGRYQQSSLAVNYYFRDSA